MEGGRQVAREGGAEGDWMERAERSRSACPTHVHADEREAVGRFIAPFTQVYLGTTVRFRG